MSGHKHIAIVTCCVDDWGGSEELWARSIPALQKEGLWFTVYKERVQLQHPEIINLMKQQVRFVAFNARKGTLKRLLQVPKKLYNKATETLGLSRPKYSHKAVLFKKELKKSRPDFAIIAQGINFDGLEYAYQCLLQNIPYAIIAQKGVDFYWPPAQDRAYMRQTLLHARKCYFVSQHNKRLTEEQFGMRLSNSEVVYNPVKIGRNIIPYPDASGTIKLACVGRLFVIDKGQDILLRILSRGPWKSRPVHISFAGTGADEEGIKEMAKLLNLTNITFCQQVHDMHAFWENHHALILPSRSEGMALAVLEAMAVGRTVITTNAGGHAEIITHGENGFIGEANENDFERVMEEAWSQKDKWEVIGKKANECINQKMPASPENIFSLSILKLTNEG